jgi:hypothetical protein
MTMRCFFCRRALFAPTIFINGHPVGNVCAKKHNLIGSSATGNKRVERVHRPPKKPATYRDPHTVDLFENEAL